LGGEDGLMETTSKLLKVPVGWACAKDMAKMMMSAVRQNTAYASPGSMRRFRWS
jgi:hypothetical protein